MPASIARVSELHVADRRRHGLDEQVRDRRVGLIVAEQVRGDPVGDPQRARQERAIRVLDEHDPARDERPVWPKPDALDAACHARAGTAADASPAPASSRASPALARRRETSSWR